MKTATRLLVILFVLLLAASVQAAQPAKVEILFMNHGPLRPTINNIRTLLAKYEGEISVEWHDFDSREGKAFMQSKGMNEHIPLIIWINGGITQEIDGNDIVFSGFPSGTGPSMFQGTWNMDMLDKALNQAIK